METTIGSKLNALNGTPSADSRFAYILLDKTFYLNRNAIEKKFMYWGGVCELVNGEGNIQDVTFMLVPGHAGDLPLMFEIIRKPNSSPMQIMHHTFVTIDSYIKTAVDKTWHWVVLAGRAEVFEAIEEEIGRMVNDQQDIAPQYLKEWSFLKSLSRCEVGERRTGWRPGLVMTRNDAGKITFLGSYKELETWAQDRIMPGGDTPVEPIEECWIYKIPGYTITIKKEIN